MEWRPITDFPNYEISNTGEVRRNGRTLKPQLTKKGYYRVRISNKGKLIHRLVAEAFIPNTNNLTEIDHIDRNRTNNVVSNLRWITRSENCLNKERKELYGIFKNIYNKYQVSFKRNQKTLYFGTYDTLDEAIRVRDYNLSLVR